MTTTAQKKARDKYNEAHYDKWTVHLPQKLAADIEKYAAAKGITKAQALMALAGFALYKRELSLWQRLKWIFIKD